MRSRSSRAAGDDHAGDDVGVAVDELGHRVHDQVGAERERPLQDRRREGVVDHQQRAVVVRDTGDRGDIGQIDGRVGRGLDEHQPGLRTQHRAHRVEVRGVDEVRGDAEACEVTPPSPPATGPYTDEVPMRWSPALRSAKLTVHSAAMPEEVASPPAPPSSSATASSSRGDGRVAHAGCRCNRPRRRRSGPRLDGSRRRRRSRSGRWAARLRRSQGQSAPGVDRARVESQRLAVLVHGRSSGSARIVASFDKPRKLSHLRLDAGSGECSPVRRSSIIGGGRRGMWRTKACGS